MNEKLIVFLKLFNIIGKSSKISFKNVLFCSRTYVIISLSKGECKMVRYKAYKFRIYPDELQRILIEKTFGCTRFVFNTFLVIITLYKQSICYMLVMKGIIKNGLL